MPSTSAPSATARSARVVRSSSCSSTTASTPRRRASATRSNCSTLPPPDLGFRNSTRWAPARCRRGPCTGGRGGDPHVAPLGVDPAHAGGRPAPAPPPATPTDGGWPPPPRRPRPAPRRRRRRTASDPDGDPATPRRGPPPKPAGPAPQRQREHQEAAEGDGQQQHRADRARGRWPRARHRRRRGGGVRAHADESSRRRASATPGNRSSTIAVHASHGASACDPRRGCCRPPTAQLEPGLAPGSGGVPRQLRRALRRGGSGRRVGPDAMAGHPGVAQHRPGHPRLRGPPAHRVGRRLGGRLPRLASGRLVPGADGRPSRSRPRVERSPRPASRAARAGLDTGRGSARRVRPRAHQPGRGLRLDRGGRRHRPAAHGRQPRLAGSRRRRPRHRSAPGHRPRVLPGRPNPWCRWWRSSTPRWPWLATARTGCCSCWPTERACRPTLPP